MTRITLCAVSVLTGAALTACCMAKPSAPDRSNRTYFWNTPHLQSILNDDKQPAQVCYCVKEGKVQCYVHAWMSDDDKRLIEAAPPPTFFLTDFHRPQTVGQSDTAKRSVGNQDTMLSTQCETK